MMAHPGIDLTQSVSRETLERLERFASLVTRWNPAVNLVSRASLAYLWERHIADSAQIFPLRPQAAHRWVDLGSGGGFPGIVVAILAREQAPEMTVSLVESDQRKAAFLREASRLLELRTDILCERVDIIPHLAADVISARALAPLSALCDMASRHLKPEGIALFMKGRGYAAELEEAKAEWRFDCTITPSTTEEGAAILRISFPRKAD